MRTHRFPISTYSSIQARLLWTLIAATLCVLASAIHAQFDVLSLSPTGQLTPSKAVSLHQNENNVWECSLTKPGEVREVSVQQYRPFNKEKKSQKQEEDSNGTVNGAAGDLLVELFGASHESVLAAFVVREADTEEFLKQLIFIPDKSTQQELEQNELKIQGALEDLFDRSQELKQHGLKFRYI